MATLLSFSMYIHALVSGGILTGDGSIDEYGNYYRPYNMPAVMDFSSEPPYLDHNEKILRKHLKEGKVTVIGHFNGWLYTKNYLCPEAFDLVSDLRENGDESEMGQSVYVIKYEGEEKGYVIPVNYSRNSLMVSEEESSKGREILESLPKKY